MSEILQIEPNKDYHINHAIHIDSLEEMLRLKEADFKAVITTMNFKYRKNGLIQYKNFGNEVGFYYKLIKPTFIIASYQNDEKPKELYFNYILKKNDFSIQEYKNLLNSLLYKNLKNF